MRVISLPGWTIHHYANNLFQYKHECAPKIFSGWQTGGHIDKLVDIECDTCDQKLEMEDGLHMMLKLWESNL